ncbi:MAG: hypothetical protein ACLR8Y_22505 [Alistipes indistinctus]
MVDNVIMENYWDRSQPIPAIDQIELQAHGSRVDYRNLYINELPRTEPYELSAEEQKEGFKVLVRRYQHARVDPAIRAIMSATTA